jgi:hypothetical protein
MADIDDRLVIDVGKGQEQLKVHERRRFREWLRRARQEYAVVMAAVELLEHEDDHLRDLMAKRPKALAELGETAAAWADHYRSGASVMDGVAARLKVLAAELQRHEGDLRRDGGRREADGERPRVEFLRT